MLTPAPAVMGHLHHRQAWAALAHAGAPSTLRIAAEPPITIVRRLIKPHRTKPVTRRIAERAFAPPSFSRFTIKTGTYTLELIHGIRTDQTCGH